MHGKQFVSLSGQRGVSLMGLIIVLGIIVLIASVGLKVIPHVIEYKASKDAIAAAKATRGTPNEMRIAYSKNAEINAITTLQPKDLIITKVNNETEIAFDYETRIPLFTDVALVIRFAATTDPTGTIPEKPEVAPR
jgi:hypothetical protein